MPVRGSRIRPAPLPFLLCLASRKARERRFHHWYVCPRCQSACVQRWGHELTGIQRYRWLPCAMTFNDLTRADMA